MKSLFMGNANLAFQGNYEDTREFCFVPYQVTFASYHKVKFYRDFSFESNNNHKITSYLEKEAQSTISKLNTSLLFRKGIIEKVTSDVNKSEQIIYFDITLASGVTKASIIELLGYLNNCI